MEVEECRGGEERRRIWRVKVFVIVWTVKPVTHAPLPVSPAFTDVRRCFGAMKNVLEVAMTSATGRWIVT